MPRTQIKIAQLNTITEVFGVAFSNTGTLLAKIEIANKNEEIKYGRTYFIDLDGAHLCTERCQKGVLGIASDTYGSGIGAKKENHIPIGIAGWVLAEIDETCDPGDILTNGANGKLVIMTEEEKIKYPERIIAMYMKPEKDEYCGPENNPIKVNGRHWVKIL